MPSLTALASLDLNVQIPHHFRCPISLDLMRDPVTLITGQTYDRSSIEKWVASGNTTCPVTMQKPDDFTLTPNHTLRRLIQEWCVANRSRGVERIPTPKQPVEPHKVRFLLAETSTSGNENGTTRGSAIRSLKNLAKESEKNRTLMVDLEAVPILIEALFSDLEARNGDVGCTKGPSWHLGVENPESDSGFAEGDVAEEALATLIQLPLTDVDRLNIIQPERLAFISFILHRSRDCETRINAAAMVEMLSDSKELLDVRVVLANTNGIMEGLVKLLRETAHPRAVKVGIKAVFSLCLRRQGKERAVAAGAPSLLIEMLVDVDKNDAERALGTIELLCTTEEGCAAVSRHAFAAALLVKMILKVSDRATEYAAGALLAICNFSENVRKSAVQAGIIKEVLLLIQSGCTNRAKSKAMNLLKLLSSDWLSDSCMSDYGRTDVVPF
eukprot:c34233_g1_i1 orf=484-1809(+)